MKTIMSEKILRIIRNKDKLSEALNLKITTHGKDVSISGAPEDEYIGEKVIDALSFGFSYGNAISIKTENKEFEILNIKDFTRKNDLERVRGRIIGKGGKVLSTVSHLTNSSLEMNENQVGIITQPENLRFAIEALTLIIKGAKHSNVYKGLEKNQPRPIKDLGLRYEEEF